MPAIRDSEVKPRGDRRHRGSVAADVDKEACDLRARRIRFRGGHRRGEEIRRRRMERAFVAACASFDMFVDFEERGRVFKKIVDELQGTDA